MDEIETDRGDSEKIRDLQLRIIKAQGQNRKELSEESKRKLAAYAERYAEKHSAETRTINKHAKESLEILKFLNDNGIEYTVLKGISLSYFDKERDFIDLDIFVDRMDAERIADLLVNRFGYEYWRPEEIRLLKTSDDNIHDISLVSDQIIPIDIHYRLLNYLPATEKISKADRIMLEIDGVKFPCLSKELQLFEIVLHNVYHHLFMSDRRRWIRDINTIVRNYDIDWDKFIKILEDLGQKELVYMTFRFLEKSRGEKLAVPSEVLARLRPSSYLSYLKGPLLFLACRFAWDRLFPPKDILHDRFGISPSSWLFFLAYPANWVRLAVTLILMPFKR